MGGKEKVERGEGVGEGVEKGVGEMEWYVGEDGEGVEISCGGNGVVNKRGK